MLVVVLIRLLLFVTWVRCILFLVVDKGLINREYAGSVLGLLATCFWSFLDGVFDPLMSFSEVLCKRVSGTKLLPADVGSFFLLRFILLLLTVQLAFYSALLGYSVSILSHDPANYVNGRRKPGYDSRKEGPHIIRAITGYDQNKHLDAWLNFHSMAVHMGCAGSTKVASQPAAHSLSKMLLAVVNQKMTTTNLHNTIVNLLQNAVFSGPDVLGFFGDYTLFAADQEIHYGVETPKGYVCPQTSYGGRLILYLQFVRTEELKHTKKHGALYSSEYTIQSDIHVDTVATQVVSRKMHAHIKPECGYMFNISPLPQHRSSPLSTAFHKPMVLC